MQFCFSSLIFTNVSDCLVEDSAIQLVNFKISLLCGGKDETTWLINVAIYIFVQFITYLGHYLPLHSLHMTDISGL